MFSGVDLLYLSNNRFQIIVSDSAHSMKTVPDCSSLLRSSYFNSVNHGGGDRVCNKCRYQWAQ